jgi:hypothetical protein
MIFKSYVSSSVGCGDCVVCTSLATEQLDFLWDHVQSLQLLIARDGSKHRLCEANCMQAGIRLACGSATFRAKDSHSIERRPIDYVPTATLGSCCATYSFMMQAGHRYVLPYLRWCTNLTHSAHYTYRIPTSAGHDPPGVIPGPTVP